MKNLLSSEPLSAPQPPSPAAPSKRRLRANRANARLSTGPVTPEGKARSCQNAVTHALLCETTLLAFDDKEEFNRLADSFYDEYQPQTPVARTLIDDLIGIHWRRMRVRAIEVEVITAATEKEKAGRPFNRRYVAEAFTSSADNSHVLQLLNRYDARFTREIHRTLRLYHELYEPDNSNFQTKPIPQPDTGSCGAGFEAARDPQVPPSNSEAAATAASSETSAPAADPITPEKARGEAAPLPAAAPPPRAPCGQAEGEAPTRPAQHAPCDAVAPAPFGEAEPAPDPHADIHT